MSEQREYQLVSDALYEAVYGNPANTPVYRGWLARSDTAAFERRVPLCWDESQVIEHVRSMLALADQMFVFLPDQVKSLRESQNAASEGGVEYLRYSLSLKLREVTEFFSRQPSISKLEKSLRNLQRGIERRMREISIRATHNRDVVRYLRKSLGLLDEIETMSIEAENLEAVINLYRLLENMKTGLDEKLKEFGGPLIFDDLHDSSGKMSGLTRVEDSVLQAEKGLDQLPEGSVKKKKKSRNPSGMSVKEQGPEKDSAKKTEASLVKLRSAVKLALEHGKLRVVVPHRDHVRRYSEGKWSELFERLDYKGKVEFLTFEEIDRSSGGYDVPILMLRSMHSHPNFWKKKLYPNIFVLDAKSQNEIMAVLN